MVDDRTFTATALATLCASRLRETRAHGLYVANMPPLAPAAFVGALSKERGIKLRVALLGGDGKLPKPAGAVVEVTADPTLANKWRNDVDARAGEAQAVNLVLGPAPKLRSLQSALPILAVSDLRAAIVERAADLHKSPERRELWRAIGALTQEIPLPRLVAYAAAIHDAHARSPASMLEQESELVTLLGLLPSKSLHVSKGPAAARKAILKVFEALAAMREPSPKQRARLAELSDSDEPEGKIATQIILYARDGKLKHLKGLELEELAAVLRPSKTKRPPSPGGGDGKRERIGGDALALDLLLNDDAKGLAAASRGFERLTHHEGGDDGGDGPPDEISVGDRKVIPHATTGTQQAGDTFQNFISEERWGGHLRAEQAAELVDALKLAANGDVPMELFTPDAPGAPDQESLRGLIERAVHHNHAPPSALERWRAYVAARRALLPSRTRLIDHPLLALAADEELRERAADLVFAYSEALKAIHEVREGLHGAGSDPAARRVVARALCLDLVFVRTSEGLSAVAAPTHPFHVWRWLEMHDVLTQGRGELQGVDRDALLPLIESPPPLGPQVVLSRFAGVSGETEASTTLHPVKTLGALPVFGEAKIRGLGRFRSGAVTDITQRLLRLMPHASLGLRVCLVDPPSVVACIEDLIDLQHGIDGESAVPLHLRVYYTRKLAGQTTEEDESVATLARELHERGGSITVQAEPRELLAVAKAVAADPVHLALVFEPGIGDVLRHSVPSLPTLSPLFVPKTYKYDAFDDRLEVIVAGEALAFQCYHDLFCQTLDMPRADFVGRKSGVSASATALGQLTLGAVWLTVIDANVEPTLRIGSAARVDWRTDAGRDVVTWSTHTQTVDDLIGEVVREAHLADTPATKQRVREEMFKLSGEAMLALVGPHVGSGRITPQVAKGVMGVVAAHRWYLSLHPGALVVSLDDDASRRWILGANTDDRRGDLLSVRSTTEGLLVEVIEVKAHDDLGGVVDIKGGVLEGHAARQVDQTLSVIEEMFKASPSPIAMARREVLRDQLYRAVAARGYTSEERAKHVNVLGALFDVKERALTHSGLIVRVTLQYGPSGEYPSAARRYQSPMGRICGLADLTENGSFGASTQQALPTPPPSPPVVSPGLPPSPVPYPGPKRASAPEASGLAAGVRERPAEVRVLIGRAKDDAEVWWDPHRPDRPLNNFGVLVTGDSGAGKTQMLRAIVAEVAHHGLPVCIVDFKGDYVGEFAQQVGLRVYDVNRRGLPFNPLALAPDDRGEVQPIRQVHELAGILKRIYKLGDQQQARLRAALQTAYTRAGIQPDAWIPVAGAPPSPGFNLIRDILAEGHGNETLLNRLSPLFDLRLFPDAEDAVGFEGAMREQLVIDLHALPSDEVKLAIAEFIIVRLHGMMLRGDQPRALRRVLLFDEAWRVKDSDKLEKLAREGRAFGVGLVIGVQFPGDLPENLSGNLATQLLLANQKPDHQREIVRTLRGAATGVDAQRLLDQINKLQKFEGFLKNAQHAPYVLVRTIPHHERG